MVKAENKSQEKLKSTTYNLRVSSYFHYQQINSITFASVYIC